MPSGAASAADLRASVLRVDYLIDWCGFLGAWLLVAGPLNQAALELQEAGSEAREELEEARRALPPPERISPAWWLVPPVAYLKIVRRQQAQRAQMMSGLTAEQTRSLVTFINVGNGWFLVAAGAALIAAKETWEVTERMEWPLWVFFALYVVAALAATGYTVARQRRSHQVMDEAERTGPATA